MKQKTKHTPGPWYPHYAKADHCLSSSVWGHEPGNQVAVIGGKSLEIMNANAALIAAAPAMYEEVRAAFELLIDLRDRSTTTPAYHAIIQKRIASMRQALAQAEGK